MLRKIIVFLSLSFMLGAGLFFGHRIGKAESFHEFVGIGDARERRNYAIRYALGLERFEGITGQDLWILHTVHPGVTDGFFVDVGSADGVEISNSWALERNGWNGICIDPFPRNMQTRTCRTFAEAVDSTGGRTVQFQNPGAYSGGILEYAGWWVTDEKRQDVAEVRTTTLEDALRRGEAPEYIHYLNIDIEGAEYEALRNFPFDKYSFGAITIEHNNVEQRRQDIRDLLLKNGYRLEWAIRDQDWYVPADHGDGPASD